MPSQIPSYSLRMSPELKATLQALAGEERRSLSNYILMVLEDHAAERAHAQADEKRAGKPKVAQRAGGRKEGGSEA